MLTAIIVDDVPQAIENLKVDLNTYCPEVRVIAEADGVVNGAKVLRNQQPDIVFLDIQLQDGTGFDLLEILQDIRFKIIFTTASDAFAIQAFRFSAVDYLLKPIDPDELIEAVGKATQQMDTQPQRLDLLIESVKEDKHPTRIALHTLEKIHIAEIAEVVRCESNGNYTIFYFSDGQKLLVTKTLKEFEKLLVTHGFIRVHQSHLINSKRIKAFVKTEGGYLLLKDGAQIPVSTRKRPVVLKMLEHL